MQQFRINSQVIEDKYNSLLPSQGGQGAGVDLSASTMVIPIIDLTVDDDVGVNRVGVTDSDSDMEGSGHIQSHNVRPFFAMN